MQLPHLKDPDRPPIPMGTDQSDGGMGMGGVGQVVRPGATRSELHDGRGTACGDWVEPEGHLDAFERAAEIGPGACVAYISRGDARYHSGDPGCEADYRTAFLLDAQLAAPEFVRRLKAEIRDDLVCVFIDCRKRLSLDSRDVVARARLGLTLLMLHQDDAALRQLQQVFLQSAPWRPFLRLLVNEARQRRSTQFAQGFRGP